MELWLKLSFGMISMFSYLAHPEAGFFVAVSSTVENPNENSRFWRDTFYRVARNESQKFI
jgi:hypothetical protein